MIRDSRRTPGRTPGHFRPNHGAAVRWRVPFAGGWFALITLAVAVGCSRLPDSTYTLRSDADKLEIPEKHARQVAAYLAMFHGTPANPRMAEPDEAAVEEATEAFEAAVEAREDAEEEEPDAADEAEPAAGESPGPSAGGTGMPGVYPIAGEDRTGFDRLTLQLGRQVYTAQCAGCHGTTGDGKGPAGAHLNPPPRDYRNGVFKFTSTPRGSKPRREDLRRILKYGAKGTSMPAFRFLPEHEREAVIDYVQMLSSRGELELALLREAENELFEEDDFDPEVVAEYVDDIADSWQRADGELVRPITVNPPATEETIQAGAVAFAEFACIKCHGPDARGSKSADVGQDIWGRTAYPANLALGMLHGGRRPIDIYRRIYSGINGTPMPSSKDPNTAIGETPEERSDKIWHLVHFVTAVIEGSRVPPDCQEAIYDVLQEQSQPAEPAVDEASEERKAAAVGGGDTPRLAAAEASR
jgi:mono/diheme cytochrome c family protein